MVQIDFPLSNEQLLNINVGYGYDLIPANYACDLNGGYYKNGKDLTFNHEKHALSADNSRNFGWTSFCFPNGFMEVCFRRSSLINTIRFRLYDLYQRTYNLSLWGNEQNYTDGKITPILLWNSTQASSWQEVQINPPKNLSSIKFIPQGKSSVNNWVDIMNLEAFYDPQEYNL